MTLALALILIALPLSAEARTPKEVVANAVLSGKHAVTGAAHPTNTPTAEPRYPLVSWSDPSPKLLIATAPVFLGRPSCCQDTLPARSWMRLQVAVQQRAIDYARPRFAPVVVAEGPEVAPGAACSLYVNREQEGDVLCARFVNLAGAGCWGGAKDSTSWKPVEAW